MRKLRGMSPILSMYQVSHMAQVHKEVCNYPAVQPGTRKRKERESDMEDRLQRLELLLRAATEGQGQNQTQTQNQFHNRDQIYGERRDHDPSVPYTAVPISHESSQSRPARPRLEEPVNNKSPLSDSLANPAPDGGTARGPQAQGSGGHYEETATPQPPRETANLQFNRERAYNNKAAVEYEVSTVIPSSQARAPGTRESIPTSVAAGNDVFDSNSRKDGVSTMRFDSLRFVVFC